MSTELTQGGHTRGGGLYDVLDRLRGYDGPDPGAEVTRPAPAADLQLVTVDRQGRVPLRRSAELLGWAPGQTVALEVDGETVRMSLPGRRTAGVDVALDRRLRVQLPYGVRVTTRFRPGTRLIVLAVREDGIVAAAPLSDLIDRFVGRP